MTIRDSITTTVEAARTGDVAAFRELVVATQDMAYAVAYQVLHHESDARDAVQEAYLTAFKRLGALSQPEAFPGWLRRIVVAVSLSRRRRSRSVWVSLDEVDTPPLLDAEERHWTDHQQQLLARALLTLSREERRIAERHYHGGWTAERLARHGSVAPPAMRKRLQRIREKLRKEVEMDEKRTLTNHPVPGNLPDRIVELLARPRLVDLPDNPVSLALDALRGAFDDYEQRDDLPEELDLEKAEAQLGGDAVYIDRANLQRIDGDRVLRYDLTLPLLMSTRWKGAAQRIAAAGKVYRRERESATHLEAFHQMELFIIDDRGKTSPWDFAGRILESIDRALPRSEVRVTPTEYPMCARAWSLDVRHNDDWTELMAWGEYADWVMRALHADPRKQIGMGAGFGLERVAALRYGLDDLRKLASARIAPQ